MMNFLVNIPILMGIPGAGGTGGSGGSGQVSTTFITFALVIGIFYFLIIRPQNKRKKETQSMLTSLTKNDKIATIGGIRGVVQDVKDDTVIVKVDDSTKMEFSKSAIATVLERKEAK